MSWQKAQELISCWDGRPCQSKVGRKAEKWAATVPLSVGSWVPILHNVAWAEAYLRIPSGILIYLTVWPQYINVTDRQIDRQRSDSIERTVLETVAQENHCLNTFDTYQEYRVLRQGSKKIDRHKKLIHSHLCVDVLYCRRIRRARILSFQSCCFEVRSSNLLGRGSMSK